MLHLEHPTVQIVVGRLVIVARLTTVINNHQTDWLTGQAGVFSRIRTSLEFSVALYMCLIKPRQQLHVSVIA